MDTTQMRTHTEAMYPELDTGEGASHWHEPLLSESQRQARPQESIIVENKKAFECSDWCLLAEGN